MRQLSIRLRTEIGHTVLATEAVHFGAIEQCHVSQDRLASIIELESILWWIDVVSILVSPALEEVPWSLTAEAVIVGHKAEKGKGFWKPCRTEARVMADVRDPGIPCVIRVGAITGIKGFQGGRLCVGKHVSESSTMRVTMALPAASKLPVP